jgi:nitrite reductase/ring-hydroxylating ferredoxin subunit
MFTQVLMQEDLPEGKNKAIIHNNAGYVGSSFHPAFIFRADGRRIAEYDFDLLICVFKGCDLCMWTCYISSLFLARCCQFHLIYLFYVLLCRYVLVKKDDALYAIQASCTSCKFPIIEGKVRHALKRRCVGELWCV